MQDHDRMTALFLLSELWPVLLTFIAFIIWLVRLEGRASHNHELITETSKDVEALRIKHDSLDSKLVQELAGIRESLVRLETTLHVLGVSEKNLRSMFEREP